MPYFLAAKNLSVGQIFSITGQEADHIVQVRRAKAGEQIKVQGPDGRRFLATIETIKKHEVVAKAAGEIQVPAEPAVKIVLFQSVVASGTLDTILQKATELGAAEVVLFNSQFTATRLSSVKYKEKLPRFQKILWEAAKQCERAHPPTLSFEDDVSGAVKRASNVDGLFIFDISGEKFKMQDLRSKSIGLVIGPEGGLSAQEISQFQSTPQFQLISFGPLLLKADTAAIAAAAVIQSLAS